MVYFYLVLLSIFGKVSARGNLLEMNSKQMGRFEAIAEDTPNKRLSSLDQGFTVMS